MVAEKFNIDSPVWAGVSKLIEESGELVQVLGKLMATDGEPEHWDGSNLRDRMIEEMGDVFGAIEFVSTMNFTDEEFVRMRDRARAKFSLFSAWREGHADARIEDFL